MIKCTVEENTMGHLTVSFGNKSIYLQSDIDRANFAVNCGLIVAPYNWDNDPNNLSYDWVEADFESIEWCPEAYETLTKKG